MPAVVLSQDEWAALGKILEAAYNDPALFAEKVLLIPGLRSWQLDVCRRIAHRLNRGDRRLRVVGRTCHGAGKTFLAALILLWFMTERFNARGLTTAPTWAQVETVLWPEVAKLYNRSLLKPLGFGRLLNTKLNFGETWFAIGASSDRPENLEGQHSDFASIRLVDEAKAVEPNVFEATEGLLNSPESLDFWISTPSIETGDFFDRDMGADPDVIRFVVDVDQLIADPLMSQAERDGYAAWKRERAEEWGEESAEYQSRVMAKYIDNAEGALFPSSWIERAITQTFEVKAPVIAGMDVAGSVDGDQSAVALVYGPDDHDRIHVHVVDGWNERDTMKSKGRAVAIAKPVGAPLRVDTIGIGKGVADSIAADGYPMQEYRASEKPKDDKRFSNRKAEDAWSIRQKMEKGLVRLTAETPSLLQKVKSQMRSDKYEILQTGKLRVVDPEDSPDLVDAVIIGAAEARIGFAAVYAEDF